MTTMIVGGTRLMKSSGSSWAKAVDDHQSVARRQERRGAAAPAEHAPARTAMPDGSRPILAERHLFHHHCTTRLPVDSPMRMFPQRLAGRLHGRLPGALVQLFLTALGDLPAFDFRARRPRDRDFNYLSGTGRAECLSMEGQACR